MADPFADLRRELAVANRVLANEGITDAFGHMSARARPAFYAFVTPARGIAGGQVGARMRVPLRLHHAQRRAAAARAGDRNAEPAVARRGREMRRPQSRKPRRRARLGILGDAPAQ